MSKKVTIKQMYERMIAHYEAMGKDEFAEEIDFLNGRIEQLEKKATADKKETDSDRANEFLREHIVTALADGKKMTVSGLITAINPDFMEAFPSIFLSSSRVTHLVTDMVKDGVLVRTTEKSKAYFALA
jgi:polyhydroxyalkanoate synthesis regulator phasin